MRKDFLLKHLETLSRKSNTEWLAELSDRKVRELEFHDLHRDQNLAENLEKDTYEKLYGNKKYYKTVTVSSEYYTNWIKDHSEKRIFLDYACGNGDNAIRAAQAGADIAIGLDISRISVQNAQRSAAAQHLNNTFFLQGDCENTGLPDNCIDAAICSGMLHHLDLSYALCELRRILKPGGVILAVEALDYNPFIKLYRNLTPSMRTDWEKNHILSYKDITFASRFFAIKNIKHWHLFSIAGAAAPRLLPLFNAIDNIVLKIPAVKLWSWMFSFEMHKTSE